MFARCLDRLSLRTKAVALALLVTLPALGIVAATGINQILRQIAVEQRRTVETVAQSLASSAELALAVRDLQELTRLANNVLRDDQNDFVAVYDAERKLLVHAERNPAAWQHYVAGNVERQGFVLSSRDVSVAAADNEFSPEGVAGPSMPDKASAPPRSGMLGCVVVGRSTAAARLAQRRQIGINAAVSVAAAALSAMAVLLAVRTWTKRLGRLVSASEGISIGDFSVALADSRHDEIGTLNRAYENMQQAVRQRDAELRQLNGTLQQQVEDRTRDLKDALLAAEQASEAKSGFLASMSHEIRTPLNGVVGMIDLLMSSEINEHQRRYCGIAKSSARALLNLINDILDFSKIEAGRLELEHGTFNLPQLIEDVTESMSYRAAERDLELACLVATGTPAWVAGDSGRLRQILTNLIGNAVKFTEKGSVAVRADMLHEDATSAAVKITVTDTGIGIPKEKLSRLFQSFSQVDASTTRKYGGTGLGLAICKRLVEFMGGQIGVESQEGQGSAFWFTVRLERQDAPAGTTSQPSMPGDLRNLRVLVVDDDATNREILQESLTSLKLLVSSAQDGPTALHLLRKAVADGRPFSIAILDWHMPGMDGTELASAIRASADLRHTAMVMLTSIDDRIDPARLRSLGFVSQLMKPVRQSLLFDTIGKAMAIHAGSAAASASADECLRPSPGAPMNLGAHVLLAEDNDVNQLVAAEILSVAGCTCDIVDNGAKAVEAVFTKHYDLVLMDCQMPGMDGFEATRLIRKREASGAGQGRHIPIIALTANAIKGDRETCLAAGMDAYSAKPIDPTELIRLIGSLAATRSAGAPQAVSSAPAPAGPTGEAGEPAPEASVPTTPAPVNAQELLARCMQNAELACRMLKLFQGRLDEDVQRLGQMLRDGQTDQAAKLAHSLKGSAANLSANRIKELAFEIEKLSGANNVEAALQRLAQLSEEARRCIDYIPRAIPVLPAPARR